MAEEQYVTLAEVRDMLVAENGKREELLPSQKNALSQAEKYALPADKAKELVAQLSELDFVESDVAVKITDILPKFPSEVRAAFYKKRITLDADMIQKVLDIVNQYL